jgi:hypothetical protein
MIIETRNPNEVPDLSSDQFTVSEIYRSLETLRSDVHFKKYLKLLQKRLDEKKDVMVREENDSEVHRIQGFVQGLKYAMDVETMSKFYQNKLASYANSKEPEKRSKKS